MAVFNKLNGFVEHLAEGVHNFQTHQLAVALSNVEPASEATPPTGVTTNCILANVTEIDYTNLSSRDLTTVSSSQTGGVYSLVLDDLVLSATGTVGPFRYVYVYNDTPTSPVDPLIGYYDYGSELTLANGESLTVDFGANLFTLSYTVSVAENFIEPDFVAAGGTVYQPTIAPGAVTVAPNYLAAASTVYNPTVIGVAAPVNTVAPAVTGTGYVGQTLTTTNGTWTGSPTGYTYQWQRNTGSWGNISGATSSTYVVTLTDEGVPVRCVVTATNAGGSTAANSNAIEQWVPDDLGVTIVAWWDAYSPSTITHSGGAVSSWASRVGSVTADQATGSLQPTYSATARNSRPGVTGDGGDRLQFSSMSTFPNGSALLTIAAAHYLNNTSATSLDTLTGYGTGSIMINAYTPWGEALRTRYDDSSNTRTANGPSSIPNTDAVSLHYYRSGQIGVRGNGNTEATDIRTNDIPSSSTSGYIFARGAFGNWYTRGTAKEILYINADVTGSDAESLEGYLAHRWGATSMLPSGHPYKTTAPTP